MTVKSFLVAVSFKGHIQNIATKIPAFGSSAWPKDYQMRPRTSQPNDSNLKPVNFRATVERDYSCTALGGRRSSSDVLPRKKTTNGLVVRISHHTVQLMEQLHSAAGLGSPFSYSTNQHSTLTIANADDAICFEAAWQDLLGTLKHSTHFIFSVVMVEK